MRERQTISQADVTTAVAYTFANTVRPKLGLADDFLNYCALPDVAKLTIFLEGPGAGSAPTGTSGAEAVIE